PTTGLELWKSDGTAAGTAPLKDINTTTAGSNPYGLTDINGTLFFAAFSPATGTELWKSDGTAAGTKDIRPGSPGPASLTTAAGTVLVKDINPGPGRSDPSEMTLVNGQVFFTALDPVTGVELWKTDGTPEGTVLVKDINPGPDWSVPRLLTAANGLLFFRVD